MILTKNYEPEFRDVDHDGMIGARGFVYCFQEASTKFHISIGKGNNVIPYRYGLSWILTKYHVRVLQKAPLDQMLRLETWIDGSKKSPVRMKQKVLIGGGDAIYATGEMEMCVSDLANGRIGKLSEIEFPNVYEVRDIETPKVGKLRFEAEGMQPVLTRPVTYSDLDNNRHMNNLHFVDLAISAFDSEFYDSHAITDIELEYVAQCHEGDTVTVLRREVEPGVWNVALQRSDGALACRACITVA